jgi:phosphoglycerate dehydrogenase-like enzyme
LNNQLRVLVVDPDGTIQRILKDTPIPPEWEFTVLQSSNPEELYPALQDSEVLVVRNASVGRAELEAASNLRLVQKFGRRTENIDLGAARDLGIRVGTMPLEHGVWVAEHALMLMLALTKKLLPAYAGAIAGENPEGIQPFRTTQTRSVYNWTALAGRGTLFRRTLGIVGLGEIGTEVAIRAKSFEMEILYYNPPGFCLAPEAEAELRVTFQPLHQLLPQVDYVTLHVPHTSETEALFGSEEFALMKPSVYFINCSRGGVVDERALCHALATEKIAGAGLDVFEYEPLPPESQLLHLENVILTPHIAGGPLEAIAAEGRELIDRIILVTDLSGAES